MRLAVYYPVHTILPVVKPVVRYNRFDKPVVCLHDTAGCQTGLYNRFDNHVEQTATVR